LLWDLASGVEIRTLKGHDGPVLGVAISPDGRTALSGSHDHTLKLWDLDTGWEIRTLSGHTDAVLSAAFSPDGKTALSGSADNTLKVWDFGRGSTYLAFEKSVPEAQAALLKNSSDPAALGALGDWYAFRHKNDWAMEFLEKARAGGVAIDRLTLGRCYWELISDLPPPGTLTAAACRAAAEREYRAALVHTQDVQLSAWLGSCADAIANTGDEFWFDFDLDPAGTQHWRRVDAQHWRAEVANGPSTDFVELEPEPGQSGTIVLQLPDRDAEVLIPKRCGGPIVYRKAGDAIWTFLGTVRSTTRPTAPTTQP